MKPTDSPQPYRSSTSIWQIDRGITTSIPQNFTRLATAILQQAANDWKSPRTHRTYHFDLVTFFHSEWFEDLCTLVGRHPEEARRQLDIPAKPSLEVLNPTRRKEKPQCPKPHPALQK